MKIKFEYKPRIVDTLYGDQPTVLVQGFSHSFPVKVEAGDPVFVECDPTDWSEVGHALLSDAFPAGFTAELYEDDEETAGDYGSIITDGRGAGCVAFYKGANSEFALVQDCSVIDAGSTFLSYEGVLKVLDSTGTWHTLA